MYTSCTYIPLSMHVMANQGCSKFVANCVLLAMCVFKFNAVGRIVFQLMHRYCVLTLTACLLGTAHHVVAMMNKRARTGGDDLPPHQKSEGTCRIWLVVM